MQRTGIQIKQTKNIATEEVVVWETASLYRSGFALCSSMKPWALQIHSFTPSPPVPSSSSESRCWNHAHALRHAVTTVPATFHLQQGFLVVFSLKENLAGQQQSCHSLSCRLRTPWGMNHTLFHLVLDSVCTPKKTAQCKISGVCALFNESGHTEGNKTWSYMSSTSITRIVTRHW